MKDFRLVESHLLQTIAEFYKFSIGLSDSRFMRIVSKPSPAYEVPVLREMAGFRDTASDELV